MPQGWEFRVPENVDGACALGTSVPRMEGKVCFPKVAYLQPNIRGKSVETLVTEQFLDVPDIRAVSNQGGCAGPSKGVWTDDLGNSGLIYDGDQSPTEILVWSHVRDVV